MRSFWSVNLITLGLYGMSYVYAVPDGARFCNPDLRCTLDL
jgi:hypothetical protein